MTDDTCDECGAEVEPQQYIPGKGDMVRVLEIHEDDGGPHVNVGETVLVEADCYPMHDVKREFVLLSAGGGLTYAKVERVQRAVAPASMLDALETIGPAFKAPLAAPVETAFRLVSVIVCPVFMSRDPAVRKRIPVATGFYKYFTDAIKCVSIVSRIGNEQHNPGQPLHWAKEKSSDEEDACARHQLDALSAEPTDEALAELGDLGHLAQRAWRAMAALQRACDAKRKAYEEAISK